MKKPTELSNIFAGQTTRSDGRRIPKSAREKGMDGAKVNNGMEQP